MSERSKQPLVETGIVVIILIWASIWGTMYWNRSLALGRRPFFYQSYLEPAVMVACGRGFVIAQPQVPAMTRFLNEQAPEFNCADIPPDIHVVDEGLSQGSARYMMTAIGLTWRVVGVAWDRLGPLAGILFGVTIAAAYGIFRLGMGCVLASLCAWALSMSTLHLANLPHLRDYSKAPFTLLLVFLLGLLVTLRPSWKRVLAIAAAYGVVTGIGYGFRSDVFIGVPIFCAAAFLFIDAGRLWQRLAFGAAAVLVFLSTFAVSGWPVIQAVNKAWGCEWHTTLLGLSDEFTQELRLESAPYEFLRVKLDDFAYVTSTSFAARVDPNVRHIEYCSASYDRVTRSYMLAAVWRAPADIIVRAYASVLQMVQLPLRWRMPPMEHSAVGFYNARKAVTTWAMDAGLFLVLGAVFVVMAVNFRLGLFLMCFILYFGGFPAVQFANRHYFDLEFMTWWAFGFLAQALVATAVALVRAKGRRWPALAAWRRAAVTLTTCVVLLWVALWGARWYQRRSIEPFMQQYLAAPRDVIATEAGTDTLQRITPASTVRTDPETAGLLEVDVDESRCAPDQTIKFVYAPERRFFGRTIALHGQPASREPTHIFMPVYGMFQGVDVGAAPAGCLAGVYRVRDPRQFTLMPEVILRPGWAGRPLHQYLDGWGIEPPPE